MRLVILFIFGVLSFYAPSCFALQSGKKLCVQANGNVQARTRCRKVEKELSGSALNEAISVSSEAQGPAGAVGVGGVSGIQGPQGPAGPAGQAGTQKGPKGQIDLAGCRVAEGFRANLDNPTKASLYAEAFCNGSTEFVLEDSYVVSFFNGTAGTKVVIQGRTADITDVGGDKRESSVGVTATRLSSVGNGAFQLVVKAVCCPR